MFDNAMHNKNSNSFIFKYLITYFSTNKANKLIFLLSCYLK